MNQATDLKNKRILLFIPNGKGVYGTGVFNELERRGAKVTIYDERPSSSPYAKAVIRLAKNHPAIYFSQYIKSIVRQNQGVDYDIVLVIRGEAFTPSVVSCLRNSYPNARFILYLWDSLNNTDTRKVFPYFDNVFSFDPEDVNSNPGLTYRSTFYLDAYKESSDRSECSIDVSFIGTAHTDRYPFIRKIDRVFQSYDLNTFYYLYMPGKLAYYWNKIRNPAFKDLKPKDFKYKMLSLEETVDYMSDSRATLDIHHPLQNGLTMRTIEVLGVRRKLITTNKSVTSYDFYNEDNILVVDRMNPQIDLEFIIAPYQDIDKTIYKKYSIQSWVDDIFV
jgi:hypothetical protein